MFPLRFKKKLNFVFRLFTESKQFLDMEQNIMRRNMWNSAGKAAIILGLISTAYLFITQYTGHLQLPVFIGALLGFILWAAKFGGCIWLMMFFMKKFVKENSGTDNSATLKFGMITAFLSALIFAAAAFADVAFINTDQYAEVIDTTMQTYAKMLDSNSMNALDKLVDKLPQITFFSNLIYCFFFGSVLSAILSRNIPSKNPFSGIKAE